MAAATGAAAGPASDKPVEAAAGVWGFPALSGAISGEAHPPGPSGFTRFLMFATKGFIGFIVFFTNQKA